MILRDKTFYKTFFYFFVILVFQNIIRFAVNLTDNIMLGSYHESALAGATAVNHLQFVLQQAVMGIGNGLVILGTQYWGQKRTRPIRRLSAIAMWFGLLAGILLFGATVLFPRALLQLFTYDEEIINEGMKYLETIRYSYLFFAVSVILTETLRAVEIVRISLYVALVGLVANFCINFVLIFGHFGFPEMGIRGAGIGTLTARILELVTVLIFLRLKGSALNLRLVSYLHIDRTLLRDFVRVSSPLILVSVLWGLSTAAQTMILGHLNSIAIAANSAANALYLSLKVAMIGACSAASIMIGKAIGEGRIERVKDYAQTLQVIFICIGLVLGASIYLLRSPFLSLYNLSPETLSMCYSVPPDSQHHRNRNLLSDANQQRNHQRRRRYPVHHVCRHHQHLGYRSADLRARCVCLALEPGRRHGRAQQRSGFQMHSRLHQGPLLHMDQKTDPG